MSRFKVESLPEFQGQESLPEAVETLFNQRLDVGGVVVRKFFEPEAVVHDGMLRFYTEAMFTDEDAVETAHEYASMWWDEHGYPGTHLETPRFMSAVRHYNGFASEHESEYILPVMSMYASMVGRQAVYVAAGPDRAGEMDMETLEEHLRNHTNKIDETRMRVKRVPTESSYRLMYDSVGHLEAGDIALVMGHPSPARAGVRSRSGSEFAQLHYRFAEGMSIRKQLEIMGLPSRRMPR